MFENENEKEPEMKINSKVLIAALISAAVIAVAGIFHCTATEKRISEEQKKYTITEGGSYVFSRAISEKIFVDAGENDEVEIILDGVNLENPDGPCIKVSSAASVILTLKEGTQNVLISGDSEDKKEEGSAVISATDITVDGKGSLTIYGYDNNGIHSRKCLSINDGEIMVFAKGDCIQAADDLTVNGGTVYASTLGVKDISDLSSFKAGKAEALDLPLGGGFGAGAPGNSFSNFDNDNKGESKKYSDPKNIPDRKPDIPNGNEPPDNRKPEFIDKKTQFTPEEKDTESETGSSKGLKAGKNITIKGGKITVLTSDDSIHSDGNININGGILDLSSGDDGIHADDSITISEAEINVRYSYEGIEAKYITVNSGNISVTSTDDGFNANGMTGIMRFGKSFEKDGTAYSNEALTSIVINGGNIGVNAQGDGLDSNGDLIINGGTIIIDGPSMSANGALDSGSENGGSLIVNGAVLLAIGSSGMAEAPGQDSMQAFVYENIDFREGSTIRISDSYGKELLSHISVRSGNNIIFSFPGLKEGDLLRIMVDDNEKETEATRSVFHGFDPRSFAPKNDGSDKTEN